MKVSVLIITYNQEKYIEQAVRSVLKQDCPFEWEVLIGDDASTDSTPEICRRLADEYPDRIRLFLRRRNVGIRSNYYALLHEARGEYVADLGGDDWWCHSGKLALEAAHLDANPTCTLVHTAWQAYHEADGHLTMHAHTGSRIDFLSLLTHEGPMPVHLCSAMYRRDTALRCYRECPEVFSAPDVVFEDYQLIISLAARGRIDYLPEDTLRYRVHTDSVSNSRSPGRDFRIYLCTLRVTRRLQLHHRVPDEKMRRTYRELLAFVYACATRSHDPENVKAIDALAPSLPVSLPLKTRVRRFLAHMHIYV